MDPRPVHRHGPPCDGMLFVRTGGIADTMVKAPLIVAGLLVVALAVPLQPSSGSTRDLEIIVYPDGTAHVSAAADVDPLEPDFVVDLFGPSVDNLVITHDGGILPPGNMSGGTVTVDTLGSPSIMIEYDIHDLTSKQGRNWVFSFDSPAPYSLTLPPRATVVGISEVPTGLAGLENNQAQMEFGPGPTEVTYVLGAAEPVPADVPPPGPPAPAVPVPDAPPPPGDPLYAVLGAAAASAAAAAGIVLAVKRRAAVPPAPEPVPAPAAPPAPESLDPEAISRMRPDIRDDDMGLVTFIFESGGEVLEKDLRKRFLQPKTTMWRAVRRLERMGVVETVKKDQQNLVRLVREMEEK